MKRPAQGLFISGLLAGFGVGAGVLATAIILTQAGDGFPSLLRTLLVANAYTVGFIIVIMGCTNLFTEYTTIAILLVLTRQASLAALGRLWGLVYFANLIGGLAFALVLVVLGPASGTIDVQVFAQVSHRLTHHSWWVMLMSAALAGWLMGLPSWLVTAGRESITQVFFIWLVTGVIGLEHLHHAITGTVEVLTGLLSQQVILVDFGQFLLWTTVGNAIGGVVFALLIRYSILISGTSSGVRGSNHGT